MQPNAARAPLAQPVIWEGAIPLRYQYTAGVAGERFLRTLKDQGRLLVTRCARCRRRYLPPRSYCLHCFREIREYLRAPLSGYVYSYTLVHEDGVRRAIALIRFAGVQGGLIHRLDSPENVRLGMPVVPVFRPPGARRGSLADIQHFRPLRMRARAQG